jgi:2-C-methyl-D-erythritol 4-phosphate cytidylyltransferase
MVSTIIPASGMGTRFGGDIPKQFHFIGGVPVLVRTLTVFQEAKNIGEIAVTVPPGYMEIFREVADTYRLTKVKHITEGGKSRSESVYKALRLLSPETEIVLIHDAVRPYVSVGLIQSVIDAAYRHTAAVPGMVFSDTVKEVDAFGRITATPDRNRFYQVQTPQGFAYKTLMEAYKNTPHLENFTDDSAVVCANGGTVFVIPGESSNIKITTPEDLK